MPGLSKRAIRRIGKAVRRVEGLAPEDLAGVSASTPRGAGAYLVIEGLLDGDLDAPVAIFDPAPPTAVLSVYRWDAGRTLFQDTGQNVTVTNRDPSAFALLGDYIMVTYINTEWRPIQGVSEEEGPSVKSIATAAYTTEDGDRLVLVDTAIMSAGTPAVITLSPPTAQNEGHLLTVKNVGIAASNTVIVGPIWDTVGSASVFSAVLATGEYQHAISGGFSLGKWWNGGGPA